MERNFKTHEKVYLCQSLTKKSLETLLFIIDEIVNRPSHATAPQNALNLSI